MNEIQKMTKNRSQKNDYSWHTSFHNNLNNNSPSSPIKRHNLAECIKKENPSICFLQKTRINSKDGHHFKEKDEKIFQVNGIRKQAGFVIWLYKLETKGTSYIKYQLTKKWYNV